MNFFIATVGELVIVELCVLWIWLKVLVDAVRNNGVTIAHRKLLLTSMGLVLNAVAITGLMAFRLVEYLTNHLPMITGIIICYTILVLGNILFIVSAAIGSDNMRTLKTFILLTIVWTISCGVMYYIGMELKL